jgi:hypothetical protein
VKAAGEKKAGERGPNQMAPEESRAASSTSCKSCLRGAANTKRKPDDRELQDKFWKQ